jgi:flagellar protein FlaG
MENKLAVVAPGNGTGLTASSAPSSPPVPSKSATMLADDAADLRLVIEEDKPTGTFVYKTVDRRTGEVVQQFPREEVVRMRADAEYSAGKIIRAKA